MKIKTNYNLSGIVFFLFFIFLLGTLLTSCSTEKALIRKVEKHGIKESVSLLAVRYPEYYKTEQIILHDTIRDTISVIVPGIQIDSTFSELADSLTIENDKLKIQLKKVPNGWQLSGSVKPDTIYWPIEIPFQVPCPPITCPDIDKLQTADNKWKWVGIGFMAAVFFMWLVIYFIALISERKLPKFND
jgi:hypothetical protein